MASVSVKDEVSEVAGVELIATGGIERDRRTIANLYRQVPAFDRQGVGGIEFVGVKGTRESAQLGRTKLERLHPVAGEIQFTGNRKGKMHDAIVTGKGHDVALK